MKITRLYISPGHNYVGHKGLPPGEHETAEVPRVHCLAGRGIEGDRYCDHKDDYKGQITFFATDVYNDLCRELAVTDRSPGVLRRNVLTEEIDLNSLIGQRFEVQGVAFQGVEECRPCLWMETAFHPGAEALMKGRGGLRARILTDGWLAVEA